MMQSILLLHVNGYNLVMIPWNILLAIIPCLVVYYMANVIGKKKWDKLGGQKIFFMILFLIWLFFFPNTAYLFMIPRHLVNYCQNFNEYRACLDGGSWVVMFFFVYAAIGLPTFYYGIRKMEKLFQSMCGEIFARFLPIVIIPLTAIAVMFGLYERLNSWDVVFRPWSLFSTAFSYFTDPIMLFDFIGFTIFLYLIYYVSRYLIRS